MRPRFPPLGETLHLLQLTGTLVCRAELTAPWEPEAAFTRAFTRTFDAAPGGTRRAAQTD